MYIFDAHQDIADSLLLTAHGNFWKRNRVHEGWNDLHLPVNNQSDFVRLKEGAVKALFGVSCAVSVDDKGNIIPCLTHFNDTLEQINLYHQLVKESTGKIKLITNKNGIKSLSKNSLNVLLAIEGADSIDEKLVNLHTFYNLGVRSIGLTWSFNNNLAGGCNENGELTELGVRVIKEMNELGIILDLSHISEKSFFQALKVNKKPAIISHACCKAVYNHPRNVTDNQMKAVAKTGGAVGICAVPKFVGDLSINAYVNHLLHAIKVVGVNHVIIGTDFGSMTGEKLIPNFGEVSDLKNLELLLKKQGLKKNQIEKLFHKNLEGILSKVLPVI